MNDHRLFFAGAHRLEKNDFVSCLLQSKNLEARRRITVSKYNVSDKTRYYIIIYFPLEMFIQKAF